MLFGSNAISEEIFKELLQECGVIRRMLVKSITTAKENQNNKDIYNTVHKMRLNSAPFEMIKSGEKTIELRLFDEKRQQVKAGDKIVFTNNANGETLTATVVKIHRFESFEELYRSLPLLKCGYTTGNVVNAKPSDMEQYYSVEEQKKYGVVGIELC